MAVCGLHSNPKRKSVTGTARKKRIASNSTAGALRNHQCILVHAEKGLRRCYLPPIEADATLPTAARVMHRNNVGRLLVVDNDNPLRGIVTRSDLLKIHSRLDAVIGDEVMHHVLDDTLAIPPGTVQAAVDEGVVTLTGRAAHKTTATAAIGLTEAVPGVTDVVDRLAFDVDDTVTAAPPSPAAKRDPLLGWWIGRAGRASGHRVTNLHGQTVTRAAALL